jgi:hypothetical protein
MKLLPVVLLLMPLSAVACQKGYVPSDTPGVCVEQSAEQTNPQWVSSEAPPSDKMPSYQREGITIINAPSMAEADAKMDREKAEADSEGKRNAGIKQKEKL